MSELDREVEDILKRAGADELGTRRRLYRREPEPLPDAPNWGPLRFLQPATPWHLVGLGALLWFVGQVLGRAALARPLELLGVALVAFGILSLLVLKPSQPKRWRGRLIDFDTSWRARIYRRLYRR